MKENKDIQLTHMALPRRSYLTKKLVPHIERNSKPIFCLSYVHVCEKQLKQLKQLALISSCVENLMI